MSRHKTKQRIAAMALSAIMAVGMIPVSAFAETSTFPIGTSGEILAFEALGLDIAFQYVPFGTGKGDLELPDTLTATLRIIALDEEPVLDSGETDAKLVTADTVTGSAIGMGEISNTEAEPVEKTADSMDEMTVPLPVIWTSSPEYDGEAAGTYVFTPELSEGIVPASGVEVPAITVTVCEAATTGTVTAFDELPEAIRWQNTTTPEFPETVGGTVEGEAAQIPVIWEADHDYDAEFPERGLYVFTAVLDEGYSLADGVAFPCITVYIPQTGGGMIARMAGGGTADSPLEITTAAQLAEIAVLVNTRSDGLERFLFNNASAQVTLELQNDLDLSGYSDGEGWTPIGNMSNSFGGLFDGRGHKINNLTINRVSGDDQGLFGYIGDGSVVKNLGIENADILAKDYVGGVAGRVFGGTVQNCYSTGTVGGANNIGGVAGAIINGSTLQKCYSTASVNSSAAHGGGVVGYFTNSAVSNCTALNPTVTGTGDAGRVGGYMSEATLSGNIAFGGMWVTENGSSKSITDDATGLDGESKTASDIKAEGFFETLFNHDTAWTYAEGKLPGFGAAIDMPAYIVDGSDPNFFGNGTSESPYQISTPAQLAKLAELVNEGNESYNAAHYRLENDIDLSDYATGEGWVPIGKYSMRFMGIFDGNDNKITNLTINCDTVQYQGLFGYIGEGGVVKNLGVTGVSINGGTMVGGIAGFVETATLQNCYSTGQVTASGFVGGVVGTACDNTMVEYCYSTCDVNSTGGAADECTGGVAGLLCIGSTLQKCYSTGNVSRMDSTGRSGYAGGVVGKIAAASVEDCYSTGNVSGAEMTGGVVGEIYPGTAKNCYSTGIVSDSYKAGGVAGQVREATVENCAALNPSVSGQGYVERVSTLIESGTLSGNLAFEGTDVLKNGTQQPITSNANGVDGLSKTASEVFAADFWTQTAGFTEDWDTDIWIIETGKLPVLKNMGGQQASMPEHLLPAGASFFEGAGTSVSPYLIKTAADLAKLAKMVNGKTSPYADSGMHYKLENDIDLSAYAGGYGWTPIGINSDAGFKGIFDGNGKTITRLTVNLPEMNIIGLFGYLSPNSMVHHLYLSDVRVHGKQNVGGIAGYMMMAAVENCAVSGSVSGTKNVGGIAGYLDNAATTVQICYSSSSVSGEEVVGGVVGRIYDNKVQNCYSTGDVTGERFVGGVAGSVGGGSGKALYCYSTGKITATAFDACGGGIAGSFSGSALKNCVALNPSIDSGSYSFGRVSGNHITDNLSNNYAFSGIPGLWENKGFEKKDGADVTSQTLFGGSFWTEASNWNESAWDSEVWTFAEGKLPVLQGLAGQSGDGGLYLTARDIQYATVSTGSFVYNGSERIPYFYFDGRTLNKDTDYTVTFTSTDGSGTSAGTNAGTVNLTITGIGSFYGTKNITYTIVKKPITITPNSGQSKKYGEIDPPLTFANNGGLTTSDFTGELSRTTGENVGTYGISLGSVSAGGNYVLSLALGTFHFTIEQARVSEITTPVDDISTTAYAVRNATSAQGVVDAAGLPSSVEVLTDGGMAMLPITWSTTTGYNAKGTAYAVTGILTGNENIDANSITMSITVTVTPATAVNPTFGDEMVITTSDSSATAAELGDDILPASGSIVVEGVSIDYTINWNGGETLDRTEVGHEQTFTGVITYSSPPAWLTLPSDPIVNRKVTVTAKTPVTIGGITTPNKIYDGTAFAPTGTVTVTGGSVPVSELVWQYESTDGGSYNSATAPTHAGTYKLTLSVPDSSANYIGNKAFPFTIERRQITLTADNKSVIKGGTLPELTYMADNLAPGETRADALSVDPILTCPTFDGSTLGNYPITLTGGTATNNYTIMARINGTLTVAEQTYTVTFNLNGGSRTGGGELTQTVAEGGAAIAPAVSRSGYTFTGWDKAFSHVTSNLTVTASWRENDGGGGGRSASYNSTIIVTPPATDKPNSPTQGEIKVAGTVGSNGNVTVNITAKDITDAFDKALAEARKNGTEQNGITVVLRVDTGRKTASSVTVNLPRAVQEAIIGNKIVSVIVVVDNPNIRIDMDLAAVTEINRLAKSDVNITAESTDNGKLTGDAKKAIGSRPVFDLKVNYGGNRQVQSFGSGSVSVTIPYTLGANERAGNVRAVYVDAKGKMHWLTNSFYDSVEKVLRFATSHFSIYGVGYRQTNTAFTDIAYHWAKEDIEFVVSCGLLNGTSTTTFSPNTAMTRGTFVTALGRLANTDVSGYTKSSFTDVKNDAYYMGYIEWARKNNIVSGVGNEKFVPDQSITREQMAVMMSNYAKAIGYTLPKVHVENIFADNVKISSYAKEAVKQMQMAGVISGKNSNLFDPQGTPTRAEVSAVLHRFVELAISSDTAQGWTMNHSGKWMYYENGKPVTGKKDIDGSTYIFDQDGVTADVPKKLLYITYTVQEGDSLWLIARKLGCTISELERLNNRSRFSLIHPGDVLRVPEK